MSDDETPKVQKHTLASLMGTVTRDGHGGAHLKCKKCRIVYLAKEAKSQCPECGGDGEPYLMQ